MTAQAMACPLCGNRTLLAQLSTLFVVREDGTAGPFGTPNVHPGAAVNCNSAACDWSGDVRQLLVTRIAVYYLATDEPHRGVRSSRRGPQHRQGAAMRFDEAERLRRERERTVAAFIVAAIVLLLG